jgi:CAAX protease family protein
MPTPDPDRINLENPDIQPAADASMLQPVPAETPQPAAFLNGPSGVGWGFLLYLLLFAIFRTFFSFLGRFLELNRAPLIWKYMAGEIFFLTSATVPALIMARLERRPFDAYGLPRRSAFGRNFWIGLLWGIIAISVLLLALRSVGVFYFGNLALTPTRAFEYACFWGVFFLIVGLVEEFFLRGYTQFTLSRGLGFWPTAIILSTAFGAVHLSNKGEDAVGALGAALIGLFFCLTLRRTGDLWFAVGLHASWDWGETFLYGVPDSGMVAPGHLMNPSSHGPDWLSGGSVGPEASLFVFILIGLMALLFHRLYRDVKYRP